MSQKRVFAPHEQAYQSYTREEDRRRTNVHYEQPVEFFTTLTGGAWNVYSCNLWSEAATETDSQVAKLDLLAARLRLRPGMRILDVGCGWGGPLAYLASTYGVEGVGLTLSPTQRAAAEERAAGHGVDVTILERHWKDFEDDRPFDAVYTDEVIVHFNDLGGFFEKVRDLLAPGGRMLNKELHYVHRRYAEMTRAMSFINEIYGSTGNYRTLADELVLVGEAGFDIELVEQLPLEHYQRTVDHWLANLKANRERLEDLVGRATYRRFLTYLRLAHHIIPTSRMTLDIVVARKPEPRDGPAIAVARRGIDEKIGAAPEGAAPLLSR
jgi:cyclopropane-fatty-acyl-phospholipid synthase